MPRKILIFIIGLCLSSQAFSADLFDLSQELYKTIDNVNYKIGIYVQDLKTGRYIGHNENTIFRPASLIKAALIPELIKRFNLREIDREDQLIIKEELYTYSGFIKKHQINWNIRLAKLLRPSFCISDNYSANLIADYLELDNINKTLKNNGLKRSRFSRLFIDDNPPNIPVNQITPADAGKIFRNIYNGYVNSDPHSTFFINLLQKNIFNWGIVAGTPQKTRVAHMVGINSRTMNDAGIVLYKNNPYILAVLINNYPDKETAQAKIAKIADLTYLHFSQNEVRRN